MPELDTAFKLNAGENGMGDEDSRCYTSREMTASFVAQTANDGFPWQTFVTMMRNGRLCFRRSQRQNIANLGGKRP